MIERTHFAWQCKDMSYRDVSVNGVMKQLCQKSQYNNFYALTTWAERVLYNGSHLTVLIE